MGVSKFAEFNGDCLQHPIEIRPNVSVGKADDLDSLVVEKAGAKRIAQLALGVLIAIDLDGQAET